MPTGVQRYSLYRFLVGLLVLSWALLEIRYAKPSSSLFYLAAFTLAGLVASLLWSQRRAISVRFVHLQLAFDIIVVTLLTGMTIFGTTAGIFYFPIIGSAAFLVGRTAALMSAGFCAVGFAGVSILTQPADGATLAYVLTAHIFAFFLVAMLSGQLAERITEARIEHATVLECLRTGVVIADGDGRVVSANPAAHKLLGRLEGLHLTQIFPCISQEAVWEETPTGPQRWVCSQAVLPTGGRVVVVDDQTEIYKMREQKTRDERLVAVGTVAAGLAHEIRNPLASIQGCIEMIREAPDPQLLDLALAEAARLNRLVDEFLNTSHIPALRRDWVDVGDLARQVCLAFQQDGRFRDKIQVACRSTSIRVLVDDNQLRQIILNLLINAAQAMPRGGQIQVEVQIATHPETHKDGVEIAVKDEGGGIPPDTLERIFDPFYTTRTGGTGLGLALVDQVARAHGGIVVPSYRPEGGMVFHLWLPREEIHA